MAPSPEEMLQTMIGNLPEKTGKSLGGWQDLLAKEGLSGHKEIMAFLKGTQGVTHGFANLISQKAREAGADGPPSGEDLIQEQYSGAKQSLRPIYEALAAGIQHFGPEVEFAPKKTYVSLRRKKQFALIQPSTKTQDPGRRRNQPEGKGTHPSP